VSNETPPNKSGCEREEVWERKGVKRAQRTEWREREIKLKTMKREEEYGEGGKQKGRREEGDTEGGRGGEREREGGRTRGPTRCQRVHTLMFTGKGQLEKGEDGIWVFCLCAEEFNERTSARGRMCLFPSGEAVTHFLSGCSWGMCIPSINSLIRIHFINNISTNSPGKTGCICRVF
jgi:hypothetical protein